jgi:hypothetical protein
LPDRPELKGVKAVADLNGLMVTATPVQEPVA